jgi:ketosteroid isomerase-like protein
MKLIKTCIVVIICLCAANLLGQPKADQKLAEQVRKFRTDYTKAILGKKPEDFQSYLHRNVRLMPEFQKTVVNKNNALLYFKSFLSRFDVTEYKHTELDILDLGSRVIETGTFSMKVKLKSKSTIHEVQGKYLDIWEKSNGSLTLMTMGWNHNQRSEIDDQYRFDEVPAIQVAFQPRVVINSNISFELAALNKLHETAIIEHDDKVWSQFFTDDIVLLSNLHQMSIGKKAVNEYLTAHAKELPVFEKLDIRNDYIDHVGDYVIEYASHVANWKSGDASGVNTGKNIRLWRREPDHSLKIFRNIGMYD